MNSSFDTSDTLFRELPAALAVLRGPDFVFERANAEYLRLVSRSDEIVGKPLLQALPEIADQPFPAILREVYATGVTYHAREVAADLRTAGDDPRSVRRVFADVTYRRIQDLPEGPFGIFVFAIDVTEKVRARSGVQLEKIKLETVFANASAALAILRGPSGIFEKANTAYLNLFTNRPLIGKTVLEALPELRGQKFPDLIAHVFGTGEAYVETEAVAYLRRTAHGALEERFFDQSYTRIPDESGQAYGVLIHAIDVTERVLARRALAETAERLRIALDAAKLGTWSVDMRTGVLNWSPRTSELFGLPHSDEIQLELAIARIHPDDRERVRQAISAATDPRGDGNYAIDYRIVHEDGAVRWVSLLGKSFFVDTPEGRVLKNFSGTVLDVTDRMLTEQALRRSEQQFRSMAESMPQIVWTARPGGELDYINGRWSQYTGALGTEPWTAFLHPEDAPRMEQSWSRCVATGERYETELRFRRASDQTYRWFLVRAQPSIDSLGRVERWVGTNTDIEDQKAALAARNEFMSIASHELKTPLTSLKLQTQSMRRNFDRGRHGAFGIDKVGEMIGNTERQVNRLIRLVDDMLDFSRIEAGRLSIVRERTDVCAIVADVYARLREQLEAAGCESAIDCGPELFADVDRFRVEQVITNLLTNAARYGAGQPVRIHARAAANRHVKISVEDHGRGIAPENRERIFNRFERAVSASEVSGLGLGLYISRQIVEAHRGRIWVESEPGHGSVFHVELPLGGETE